MNSHLNLSLRQHELPMFGRQPSPRLTQRSRRRLCPRPDPCLCRGLCLCSCLSALFVQLPAYEYPPMDNQHRASKCQIVTIGDRLLFGSQCLSPWIWQLDVYQMRPHRTFGSSTLVYTPNGLEPLISAFYTTWDEFPAYVQGYKVRTVVGTAVNWKYSPNT